MNSLLRYLSCAISRPIAVLLACIVACETARADAAEHPIAPPVAVPYATARSLFDTDFTRIDWTDPARQRRIPFKIYFPSTGDGPFPVILFSHGLGGTREGYEYLGRQWAAHGYISIHLQHLGSDDTAWRGQDRPMQSVREAANLQNALDRDRDVKFALDQLPKLNDQDPKLKGRIDIHSVGMAGHSFGAETTMLIAGERLGGGGPIATRLSANLADDRIKAAIAMSAGVPALRNNLDTVFESIHIPIFYMTGTLDDSPIGDTKAADRRLVYDHTKNAAAAYLLTFAGGDHMVFSGRISPALRPSDEALQKQIRIASTAFWDAYLKRDPAAKKWLNDGGFDESLGKQGLFEHR